jgi:hypothetical protein
MLPTSPLCLADGIYTFFQTNTADWDNGSQETVQTSSLLASSVSAVSRRQFSG